MSCPKCDEVRQALLIILKFILEGEKEVVSEKQWEVSPQFYVNGNEYAPRGFDEE